MPPRLTLVGMILVLAMAPQALESESDNWQAPSKATPLRLHEAEILVYMLPVSHAVRAEGFEVGWELQLSPAMNQEDYFTFWLVNATRPNVEGSVTVGYFAVNKHTGDVWDTTLDRMVEDLEIVGLQKILRKAHGVHESTLREYRDRPLWSTK